MKKLFQIAKRGKRKIAEISITTWKPAQYF